MFSRQEVAEYIIKFLNNPDQEFLDKVEQDAVRLCAYHAETGLVPTAQRMAKAMGTPEPTVTEIQNILCSMVFVEAIRQRMITELGDRVLH